MVDATTNATINATTNASNSVTEFAIDDDTRNHLCTTVISICANTNSLMNGKTFVGRSTLGAFLAVQSVAPQQLGPVWGALLYVCFEIVSESYNLGNTSPKRVEPTRRNILVDMLHHLGTTPAGLNMSENALVKSARRWSRFEPNALEAVVEEAWKLTERSKVRLAIEGVLANCASAKYLFM